MTNDDFSDIGFPAQQTRVYHDPRRIFPRLVRSQRREECREAHKKWLSESANREKARAAVRRWKTARKSLTSQGCQS